VDRERPFFVTFEGIEGCGKSTQVQILQKRLCDFGIVPLIIREPGGTAISERIRTILKDNAYQNVMAPETELLLMNAARAQLVREVIKPALLQNRFLIADRYFHSTLAYQAYGRQLPKDSLEFITQYAVNRVVPDVVIFLDISLEKSMERIRIRNKQLASQGIIVSDRFEEAGMDFHKRVYQGFQLIASQFSYVKRIDAERPESVVSEEIWQILQSSYFSCLA